LATSEISINRRPKESIDELARAGRDRLYPAISNPNWIVLRSRREIFRRWLQQPPFESAKVLDIGGRIQPYRGLIPFKNTYWSLDIRQTALVSILGNAECLPFSDASLDLVICTQMIEYVSEPAVLAKEVHRVLRPCGTLLLSAPSIFPRDSEQDRWRFFPDHPASTIQSLFGSGSPSRVRQHCRISPHRSCDVSFIGSLPVDSLRAGLFAFPVINMLAGLADAFGGCRDGSFTVNYSVRAVK
jgi:SAM-dependent methyltransferase